MIMSPPQLNQGSPLALSVCPQTWSPNPLTEIPLFGTDGIRGCATTFLTAPLALEVGFSSGQVLQSQAPRSTRPVVILGQDSRNSSCMLAMALSAGLTAAGVNVWHLGLCPTPGVAHLINVTGAIGGVMISASHNPPEDNGIKFFGADGSKLPIEVQKAIETGVRGQNSTTTMQGRWGRYHHRPELPNTYMDALHQSLARTSLAGLHIVLDLAWGAAVRTAPETFEALGAKVTCLHNAPDGDRINVSCGSTHLGPLQTAVKDQGADMGFAFDGDADRVLAVDDQGRSVDGDMILYLWGQQLYQQGQLPSQLIVGTVMSNLGFEQAWAKLGGRLLRTAVGDSYVQIGMAQAGAMLGGEPSGHILCSHYGTTGDGLLTALHLAALVKTSGSALSSLCDRSFRPYPQLLRNVRVENRQRRLGWQDCDSIQRAIAQAQQGLMGQGRVLVRASGTEPVIRVMVEASTVELAKDWIATLVQPIEQHLAA